MAMISESSYRDDGVYMSFGQVTDDILGSPCGLQPSDSRLESISYRNLFMIMDSSHRP